MTSGSDDNPIGERLSPAGLPTATRISADTLLGAFRHVTNSYKHLFFRALLKEIARGRREILLTDLAAGMMEEAWWPGFHFRLHLGARDSVVSRIDATVDIDGLRRDPRAVRRALEGAVTARDPLLRCIEPDRIVVSDAWMRFLGDHLAFVQGWSDALWVGYLEARNPGVPGLAAKFSPALARPSLADQAVLWRAVMEEDPVRCIYTGAVLAPNLIVVDHFVPRAFVSHDRMWNLTPTTNAINSAKSDHLPDLRFVPALADQHARVARAATRLEGRPAVVWRRALDEMASDLRIGPEVMLRSDDVCRVYQDMLGSLVGIARRMGFPSGWAPDA